MKIGSKISQIEGITILFHGKQVNTIAVTKLHFWNGGNEILEPSNFYPEKELKILIPENERILAIAKIDESSDTCNTNIEISSQKENEANVNFFCLEPKQGAYYNIYHTSPLDKAVSLTGIIKGGVLENKSIEVIENNGEIYISTQNYNIYFNGLFEVFSGFGKTFLNIFGISFKKRK